MWRLVREGMATLNELRTVYDYEDLLQMNAILDMKDDVQALMQAEAEAKQKKGGK